MCNDSVVMNASKQSFHENCTLCRFRLTDSYSAPLCCNFEPCARIHIHPAETSCRKLHCNNASTSHVKTVELQFKNTSRALVTCLTPDHDMCRPRPQQPAYGKTLLSEEQACQPREPAALRILASALCKFSSSTFMSCAAAMSPDNRVCKSDRLEESDGSGF